MTREEWRNLGKVRGMKLYTRKLNGSGWLEWELDSVFKSAAILRREKKEYGCKPGFLPSETSFCPCEMVFTMGQAEKMNMGNGRKKRQMRL